MTTKVGVELQEINGTKKMNISEEWSVVKQHVWSFNQPLIAWNQMSDDSNPKIGTTGNWMLLFPVLLCVTTAPAISGIRIPPHLAVVLSVSPRFCLRSAAVFAAGFVLFCRAVPTVLPNQAQLNSFEEAGV